jgi:hypothetical protein
MFHKSSERRPEFPAIPGDGRNLRTRMCFRGPGGSSSLNGRFLPFDKANRGYRPWVYLRTFFAKMSPSQDADNYTSDDLKRNPTDVPADD